MELINDEMELQASARQMIQTRFQSLQARYGAIHKRIVSVQEKHELLQKRAGSLLDLVHEATTAHISAEEAQWFKSLETQSAHMAAMRTKLAKLTVDDRLERKRVSSEMLGTSQLQSIKQEIAREHQELSKAIHLFRSLQIED